MTQETIGLLEKSI